MPKLVQIRRKCVVVRKEQRNRHTDGWTGRLKMRDMKMRYQIAGVETAGKVSLESQSVKKCLKVVVFVSRVIPSV